MGWGRCYWGGRTCPTEVGKPVKERGGSNSCLIRLCVITGEGVALAVDGGGFFGGLAVFGDGGLGGFLVAIGFDARGAAGGADVVVVAIAADQRRGGEEGDEGRGDKTLHG